MITPIPERGISMSAPMIRSYMAGLKGCTRRLVNPQPSAHFSPSSAQSYEPTRIAKDGTAEPGPSVFGVFDMNGEDEGYKCPYGAPGDELYFREHWRTARIHDARKPSEIQEGSTILFEADSSKLNPDESIHGDELGRFRQGRFMCRWMSRFRHILITGIRVERLGDISAQDARDEGIERKGDGWKNYFDDGPGFESSVDSFMTLWESIHGPDSWERDKGLYVWAISFPKHKN